jgi:hypothetical protein
MTPGLRMPVRAARAALAVTLGAAALAAAGAWAQPGQAPPTSRTNQEGAGASGRCGVCHPGERVQFEKSRHALEEVRCVACHGGNDQSLDERVAHGAGFRGAPARRDIPALCASCHSDERRMRAYNLPVDQYALYLTSGHGLGLKGGDTKVAVCSDCHGAHDILPPSDPASRVFVLNIPKTCGTCHGDSTLMRQRGKRDTYREYSSSVHARALFEKGNLKAPTCVSCHGVHGAAPPSVGDVGKVCGQCHTADRRYFMAGPHHRGMTGQHRAECVSCHGDHATAAAQPERIASQCATCHGQDSEQARLGGRLWTEYRTAAAELEKAAALIVRADAVPLQTDDYKARLEEARTYLREAMPAAHAVDQDVMMGFTARARSVASEVEHEIYAKLGRIRTNKFVLIVFWFYLLLTILVLRRFRDRGARTD